MLDTSCPNACRVQGRGDLAAASSGLHSLPGTVLGIVILPPFSSFLQAPLRLSGFGLYFQFPSFPLPPSPPMLARDLPSLPVAFLTLMESHETHCPKGQSTRASQATGESHQPPSATELHSAKSGCGGILTTGPNQSATEK